MSDHVWPDNLGLKTMDYLTQARTFYERARAANTSAEKEAHLEVALDMLEKALEQAERPS